jgi:DNA mismatch repair protein MutS
VDVSTGEFAVTQIDAGRDLTGLRGELTRLRPAEVIRPEKQIFPNDLPIHFTAWPDWRFEPGKTKETIRAHFESSGLEGFGLEGKPLAGRAAGAILQYLGETNPAALALLTRLRVYSVDEYMTLDAATRRNLELTETLRGELKGSLLGVLDLTVTPMGKRLLRRWVSQPLLDLGQIRIRHMAVQALHSQSMLRAELRAFLKKLNDLERLTGRAFSGHAQPRDLVAMRETLRNLPEVLSRLQDPALARIGSPVNTIRPCTNVLDLLTSSIADDPPATLQNTGIIQPGFSAELDSVIESSRHAREWINGLESVERQRTGIKTLKVGYNKVFGYYIEISHGQASHAPVEYIRKQTLVNAERYITPEMKEYEALVLNAEERIRELELAIFKDICMQIAGSAAVLLETSNGIAELDVFASLAEVAATAGYVLPDVTGDGVLEIQEGRHPVVEQGLRNDRYVPNDVFYEKGEIVRIITGPNMSGKSTYLRQTALIILLAQIGSFVPARAARIGIVDRIFTRIGAQDEIQAGQSTFMVEMVETANILHHATQNSLLILDEIGRGTSTYDGVSIAWAVVEYIHNHPQIRSKTLFATHYHELTQLAELLPGVRNYNVAVTEVDEKVIFLHKIIPGGADRSYGIHVAQLAGLPKPVVLRASEIMRELERSSGQAIKINPHAAQQAALFPETSPLLDELQMLDTNELSPIEALNKLFEWKKRYHG